jgi:hypothetical protein
MKKWLFIIPFMYSIGLSQTETFKNIEAENAKIESLILQSQTVSIDTTIVVDSTWADSISTVLKIAVDTIAGKVSHYIFDAVEHRVTTTESGIEILNQSLALTVSKNEVDTMRNRINSYGSNISMLNNSITSTVTRAKYSLDSTLQSLAMTSIKQTADSVRIMARRDSIISYINLAPGVATISASKINLDGAVMVSVSLTTPTVTGGSFKGGWFRTDATANRGIEIGRLNTSIRFYDPMGSGAYTELYSQGASALATDKALFVYGALGAASLSLDTPLDWAYVDHPTTVADYGITDAVSTSSLSSASVSYAATAGSANAIAWTAITGKPTLFATSDETDPQFDAWYNSQDYSVQVAAWNAKATYGTTLSHYGITDAVSTSNFTWANLGSKPSTFTPSTHSHSMSDITGLTNALNYKTGNNGPSGATVIVGSDGHTYYWDGSALQGLE